MWFRYMDTPDALLNTHPLYLFQAKLGHPDYPQTRPLMKSFEVPSVFTRDLYDLLDEKTEKHRPVTGQSSTRRTELAVWYLSGAQVVDCRPARLRICAAHGFLPHFCVERAALWSQMVVLLRT